MNWGLKTPGKRLYLPNLRHVHYQCYCYFLVPGKPSEIQNLHAEATCNSVTLKWEQPKEDGGMPIKKYVLNYESVTRHIDGNKTSNTINNLKQSTKYNITLQANNMAEWGPSSSVEIKTLEYCKFSV